VENLLTIDEVCAKLGVTSSQLQRMRSSGTGPTHLRLGHKTIRYRPADVESYLRELKSQSEGESGEN
jgi:predicted DNA-binding transcriptional regulator AlpA